MIYLISIFLSKYFFKNSLSSNSSMYDLSVLIDFDFDFDFDFGFDLGFYLACDFSSNFACF